MGADLLQRQGVRISLEPAGRPARGGRAIWPFVVAGIAVVAVVVAGAAFLLQDEVVPYQADATAITNSLAGVREQGPYVVVPEPAIEPGDAMTEVREGGTYGLPVAGSQGGSATEAREGGTYGSASSGSSTESREGGRYETP